MPSDSASGDAEHLDEHASGGVPLDVGLLSPVTAGLDDAVSDAAVTDALVGAEVALALAWADVGVAPREAADAIAARFGWDAAAHLCRGHGVDPAELASAATRGGNPVIPLARMLRAGLGEHPSAEWVHRGATSQDILDTALMRVARDAVDAIAATLRETERELVGFAAAHRDLVAAARTLTQHAVPTTVGLRASGWLRGVRRAHIELERRETPAQLGGAAGTLAAFVEIGGTDAARALPAAFAARAGLAAPEAPWHTARWPVTELGDALAQTVDAVAVIAADVATLSRTEIAELAEGSGGGSSAMPQKQNPVHSVLIRSAGLRAPQLAATLHLAAAASVDERPDGAWHAEWPTLRELLRLALGATAHARILVAGLRVDPAAVARNLGLTGGLIVSERLAQLLSPRIGSDRFARLVADAAAGSDLAAQLRALPEAADLDVDALLDPGGYTGLAGALVDEAVADTAPDTAAAARDAPARDADPAAEAAHPDHDAAPQEEQ